MGSAVFENLDPDVYAQIAVFYEAEYGGLEADIGYYARNGVSGPLLVLGCGTGRVGRVLGPSRTVTGLDRSEPMLEIARRLAPDACYLGGDMRDFDLGRFAEIVIPNGSFNFLASRAAQAHCLACCARALPVGGPLTIDMPMPDFTLLGLAHSPERLAWQGEIGDHHARRTREVWRYPVAQRIELHERYYLDDTLVATAPLLLRFVFPAEVEWMLEAAGFCVDTLHGDYSENGLRPCSPRLIAHALRA